MADALLQAVNLSKYYSEGAQLTKVLSQLNLKCYQGDTIVLTGCSGSGKSTLLHCLANLDEVSEGQVMWLGKNWQNYSGRQKQGIFASDIGFIYQFHYLLKDLTVLENVMLAGMIAEFSKQDSQNQATQLLEQVGLITHLQQSISHLSGGERQRVAVARALMCQPKIIIADEPTGSLDIHNAENIIEILLAYNAKNRCSLILTTHHLPLTAAFSQHYLLEEGELVRAR